MIDINAEAEKILRRLDCRVVFQYPDEFSSMPTVSFYTLSEGMAMAADNEELIQKGSVQIDIWARTPSKTAEIAIRINELMCADGWQRQFSMDLKKASEEFVYHKTMRFNKIFTL